MVVHKRRFEDGKSVYAKWPGSGYYYKAEILEFNNEQNHYSVKFSEGDDSIYHIPSRDMFADDNLEKRGGRKAKKGRRGRSRSRSRSTSRSRKSERNRSGSSSPIRKSSKERGRSPEIRKLTEVDGLSEKISDVYKVPSEKLALITNEENSSIETITHISEVEANNGDDKQCGNNLSTINSKTEETVSNQGWLSSTVMKKQDKDKEIHKTSILTSLLSIVLYLVYFTLTTLNCSLTLSLPFVVYIYLYLSCNEKNDCSLLVIPKIPSKYNFFEKTSFTYVFGWYTLQAFIAVLPFGRVTSIPSPEKSNIVYRLNGVSGLFISLMTMALLIYYGKFPKNIIQTDYLSLITATYIFVLLVSFIVFVVSRYSHKEEPSDGILQDFVFGRVSRPTLFGGRYDVKTTAVKAGFISWSILNLVYLKSVWDRPIESNIPLILLVSFQLWYIFDHMVFEETNLHTSSLSSQKIGFMGLSWMLLFFPFISSLQARYLSLHPHTVPWSHYIIPCVLQVSGYLIYRLSVLEKFHFKKNPHKAKLSGAVYIPTSTGKDILVSGWWGQVRHPNYLGDLLMNFSWALLCGTSHLLPWLWVISLTLSLMCMAWREDALSLKKYGKSWEEYQEDVKYRIVPFIY